MTVDRSVLKNNRIVRMFASKQKILSLYLTAGFPKLHDTMAICSALEKRGVDMIEIGMPFTDPIADGPTIQVANMRSLANGMNLKFLLSEIKQARTRTADQLQLPILLMGHLNPIIQFGVENFVTACLDSQVDGAVLPDMPLEVYEREYRSIFEAANICVVFLVTSESSQERIRRIDSISSGFIYLVSSHGVTGSSLAVSTERAQYFDRLAAMQLQNPLVVGFGIDSPQGARSVLEHARGIIIGSAFIRAIGAEGANAVTVAEQYADQFVPVMTEFNK